MTAFVLAADLTINSRQTDSRLVSVLDVEMGGLLLP